MQNNFKYSLLSLVIAGLLAACSTVDTQAVFTSAAPRQSVDLATPPGLSSPDLSTSYKMNNLSGQAGYQVNNVSNMYIATGGSQRWLVMESQTVNTVWPMVLAYVNQVGLTVKYQNPAIGVIQSDWASRNTAVPQGNSLRGIFDWIGWGSMYSLNSMYMYRVTLWQNGNNVVMMATNYQMDEEYLGCSSPGIANTSTKASSDQQQTKWIPRPPNPQLELEFLTQYMTFAGLPQEEIKKAVAAVNATVIKNATVVNNQVIVNDQFDRAWWRTAIALDRVGLGVVDKNRANGEYDVYPLQSQIEDPDPSFLQKWFGSESDNKQLGPKALYSVKLTAQGNQTAISLKLYDNNSIDPKFTEHQQKYLTELATQLQ